MTDSPSDAMSKCAAEIALARHQRRHCCKMISIECVLRACKQTKHEDRLGRHARAPIEACCPESARNGQRARVKYSKAATSFSLSGLDAGRGEFAAQCIDD